MIAKRPSSRRRTARTTVAALSLAMLASLLATMPQQATAQGHFTDTQGHFAHDSINYLMDRGVLGDSHSTWCGPTFFCPTYPVARWMASVWLVRALTGGDPAPSNYAPFSDLGASDFWTPHIWELSKLGLLKGYPDGSFRPHEPMTRRQLNTVLKRSLEIAGDEGAPLKHGALASLYGCGGGGIDCRHEQISRGESATMLASALQGRLDQSPTDAPSGEFWTIHQGISAGAFHTCALRHGGPDDDKIACWGLNHYGQLDNPNPDWRFKQVAAGGAHTCALRRDDRIDCWGLNTWNQATPPEGRFKNVAAGDVSTCAIRTDHKLVCWGRNHQGETPPGHQPDRALHDPPPYSFDNLDVGSHHACAIRRGRPSDGNRKRVYCWGEAKAGSLGDSLAIAPYDSQQTRLIESFGVGTGNEVSCSISRETRYSDGSLSGSRAGGLATRQHIRCAGRDSNNVGIAPNESLPPTSNSYRENTIGVGWWHGCVLRSDGTPRCWGGGAGTDVGQTATPEGEFRALAVGGAHTCAVRTDRTIHCWGFDF